MYMKQKLTLAPNSTRVAILLASFLLSSCQSTESKLTTHWEIKSVDKSSLLKTNANRLDNNLLIKIKNDYANDPCDADYTELSLSAVFVNADDSKLLIFFNILYIDDIQVVYEVSKDGALLNKYIYSEWQQ
jgi:hypothetical protein